MPKKCQKCRVSKRYKDFNKDKREKSGYQGVCRECSKDYAEKYCRNPIKDYHVIFDPLGTFTDSSYFTRAEIMDMLNMEYLAIGTLFRSGKREYRVNEELCLKVVV